MKNPIFETPRFILREMSYQDVDGLFFLESNPAVYKYLSVFDPKTGENLYPPVTSKEQVFPIIDKIQKQYADDGFGRWSVISKETDEFVGWCGIKKETVLRSPETYNDLGYRFRQEYWGKGIATETAAACLKYGQEKLGLTINAAASKANLASDKVLRKIGMERIGEFEFMGIDCWYFGHFGHFGCAQ